MTLTIIVSMKTANDIHIDDNPLFPETTLFLGNGFDLSLGLRTKYTDYYNHTNDQREKDFWPEHDVVNEDDQLYKRLNGHYPMFGKRRNTVDVSDRYTWCDLEGELKNHAKRQSPQGIQYVVDYENSFDSDEKYYKEIKDGLMNYLKYEVEDWGKYRYTGAKTTPAYNLMHELYKANADPNIITFNYTDLSRLMDMCEGNLTRYFRIRPDKVHHVHGSLREEHIILGINEDKEVPKEYDFLFKSWDDYYGSHKVLDTLKSSEIIIFFGLSFGSIDSVYFVDFFKSIINGKYDKHKKHILICTFDEASMREIYRQFFIMDISIMELKAHCDFHFFLTNPQNPYHPHKYDKNKITNWMQEWNDITPEI